MNREEAIAILAFQDSEVREAAAVFVQMSNLPDAHGSLQVLANELLAMKHSFGRCMERRCNKKASGMLMALGDDLTVYCTEHRYQREISWANSQGGRCISECPACKCHIYEQA